MTPNRRRVNPTKHKAKPTKYANVANRTIVHRVLRALEVTPRNCQAKLGMSWQDVETLYLIRENRQLPDIDGHPFFVIAADLINTRLALLLDVKQEVERRMHKSAAARAARRLATEQR